MQRSLLSNMVHSYAIRTSVVYKLRKQDGAVGCLLQNLVSLSIDSVQHGQCCSLYSLLLCYSDENLKFTVVGNT